jgi:hypothetical protein
MCIAYNATFKLINFLQNFMFYFQLRSCLVDADRLQDFNDLIDGPLIYEVLQQV